MKMISLILSLGLLTISASAEDIDLGDQFTPIVKIQRANTCYLHAGIGLLEAKVYRETKRHISFDDSSIIIRFLNRIIQVQPLSDYFEASRTALADNLIFYSKGKFSSPIDFGYLDQDMLEFIIGNGLIETSGVEDLTLREKTLTDIHNIAIEASKQVLSLGLPNHPANLPPEEALQLAPLAIALEQMKNLSDKYLTTVKNSLVQFDTNDFFELNLDSENLGERGNYARFNLKEAMKSYYWPQNPSESDRLNLEERRSQCSDVSRFDQVQIKKKLELGIPLAVGIYTTGVEFGDGVNFKKIYKTNGHALILTGVKTIKNDFGVDEEYWYFRDSGFFQGSTQARFSVRESCRFLKVIGI